MDAEAVVNLYGRVFITGQIRLLSGLHIGAGKEALQIGGIDNAILRDTLSQQPYIPGSSVKGKMRSLWEKVQGATQNSFISRHPPVVRLHVCHDPVCRVCPIFGVPGDQQSFFPTRLVVRDVRLDEAIAEQMALAERTDQTYTEIKYEAAIDRITSAAVPRPMERVPAGAVFGPFEMVFSMYEAGDPARVLDLLAAMQLVEDDYLGGLGSRGSGKVRFQNLSIYGRSRADYGQPIPWTPQDVPAEGLTVQGILSQRQALSEWLNETIPCVESPAAG